MTPSTPGAAEDRPEVLGIFDLVEENEEGIRQRIRSLIQGSVPRQDGFHAAEDILERDELLRGDQGHDALVVGGELVEGLLGDEEIGNVSGLGQGHDLARRPPPALLLEEDLVDPAGRGPQDLEQGVDPVDLVHGPSRSYHPRFGDTIPQNGDTHRRN